MSPTMMMGVFVVIVLALIMYLTDFGADEASSQTVLTVMGFVAGVFAFVFAWNSGMDLEEDYPEAAAPSPRPAPPAPKSFTQPPPPSYETAEISYYG